MKEKIYDPDLELLVDEFTDDDGSRRRMVYIPVDKIYPHPDNPRKDLGDVTELSESIIANGVMQNLTVVKNINDSKSYDRLVDGADPSGIKYSDAYINHATSHAFEGSYTVIIGHRRLAAAKAAGIAEVPCVISDMDYPTQISTMMTENLQRVDLTIYEQAQGFKQLKLDLGMSMDKIAEKTGFSVATVRRRLKLCDLNQDTLKNVSHRQISMEDFERLYKIEDPTLRDKALAEIGTANFNYTCSSALHEQEKKKKIEKWKQLCREAGMTEISKKASENYKIYDNVFSIYTGEPDREELAKKLDGKDPTELFFCVDQYCYVQVRRKKDSSVIEEADEKERQRKVEEQERTASCAALKEAFERAYLLRSQFIEKYSDLEAKKHILDILQMGVDANACGNSYVDMTKFCVLAGYREQELKEMSGRPSADDIFSRTKHGVYKLLLSYVYATTGDGKDLIAYSKATWEGKQGEYIQNDRLTAIYESLKRLGYEMSDEEKALMDGTSYMYYKKEEKA